ncbi:MAG: hypothetical protein AAYR33_00565 [Acetobacteraceae bacterium]
MSGSGRHASNFNSRAPLRHAAWLACFGVVFLFMTGCVPSPPSHPENICAIFKEKRSWYRAAIRQEKKSGVPLNVPMAIIHQESGFHSNLHTQRTYFLWVIPWGHITSAYGYPQAQNGAWADYERANDTSGSREDFEDSLKFINWYVTETRRTNHVPVYDARRQYLAYHEGWGGYQKGTYRRKSWLVRVARNVGGRAARYRRQFARCRESLKEHGFWSWLF